MFSPFALSLKEEWFSVLHRLGARDRQKKHGVLNILNQANSIEAPETERLSSMEAGFLLLDGPTVKHQGAGCGVYDRPISYEHYVRKFEPLTRMAVRYRQRVVNVPFHLGYPIWELDPDFDIRYHIQEIKLPEPVTEKQLHELVCKIHMEPFDMNRPLWRTYIINGVEGGRSAILGKMHHTISDGASMMAAQAMLLETERIDPPDLSEMPEAEPLPPLPKLSTPASRFTDALAEHAKTIGRVIVRLPSMIVRGVRAVTHPGSRAALKEWWHFFRAKAEKYPFNAPNCGQVHFAALSIPIDDVRAIRAAGGGTINDVLLAVVAGALERYGKKHNVPTEGRHAKIAFTANLRKPNDSERLNNRSAAATLAVPFDVSNPRERLTCITERTRIAKESGMAFMVWNFIATWRAMFTPPGLAIVYSLMSRPFMNRVLHKFMFRVPVHLYFSNIRAPEFPIYLLGAQLLRRSPVPPLIPVTGISCVAVTMHKFMRMSFAADAQSVPDVEDLAMFAADAFEEMRQAFPDAEFIPQEMNTKTVNADPKPADV
jgi:WS/DGAT/MGAT family acyltransferase